MSNIIESCYNIAQPTGPDVLSTEDTLSVYNLINNKSMVWNSKTVHESSGYSSHRGAKPLLTDLSTFYQRGGMYASGPMLSARTTGTVLYGATA